MQRVVYLGAFVLLGFLVQLVVHAVLEMAAIELLSRDFAAWSMGLTWDQLFLVHHISAIVLALLGIALGYDLGARAYRKQSAVRNFTARR